jgi:hypothetical protein
LLRGIHENSSYGELELIELISFRHYNRRIQLDEIHFAAVWADQSLSPTHFRDQLLIHTDSDDASGHFHSLVEALVPRQTVVAVYVRNSYDLDIPHDEIGVLATILPPHLANEVLTWVKNDKSCLHVH